MYEKSSADPEIMGLMPKWDTVEESHRMHAFLEVYMDSRKGYIHSVQKKFYEISRKELSEVSH